MKEIRYLQENDLIGSTALTSGTGNEIDSMNNAINNVKKHYNLLVTDNIWGNDLTSSSKETKIKELNYLLEKDIKALIIARGGELLYETLDDINYQKIIDKNILVEGYSDPTSLLYILTTNYDYKTIYGFNLKSYDENEEEQYYKDNLSILNGKKIELSSYDNDSISKKDFKTNGILLGGCIEVLKDLIGTKYDKTKEFIEKYKDEGIIWYFDPFNMDSASLYRTLLQFKRAGYFKYTNTILIGKIRYPQEEIYMTYKEAIERSLLEIENIVIDTNIGHIKPCFTLINGNKYEVEYKENKLFLRNL